MMNDERRRVKDGGEDEEEEEGELEEQRAHSTHLTLFFDENFKVLIDDRDGEKDSRSRPDSAHEVGQHGQSADAKTAERSRRRNVAVKGRQSEERDN